MLKLTTDNLYFLVRSKIIKDIFDVVMICEFITIDRNKQTDVKIDLMIDLITRCMNMFSITITPSTYDANILVLSYKKKVLKRKICSKGETHCMLGLLKTFFKFYYIKDELSLPLFDFISTKYSDEINYLCKGYNIEFILINGEMIFYKPTSNGIGGYSYNNFLLLLGDNKKSEIRRKINLAYLSK